MAVGTIRHLVLPGWVRACVRKLKKGHNMLGTTATLTFGYHRNKKLHSAQTQGLFWLLQNHTPGSLRDLQGIVFLPGFPLPPSQFNKDGRGQAGGPPVLAATGPAAAVPPHPHAELCKPWIKARIQPSGISFTSHQQENK